MNHIPAITILLWAVWWIVVSIIGKVDGAQSWRDTIGMIVFFMLIPLGCGIWLWVLTL